MREEEFKSPEQYLWFCDTFTKMFFSTKDISKPP